MLTKLQAKGRRIIVPVSGGKDSQAVLALAVDRHGADSVIAVHQATGFDHSLTMAHMSYMAERYGLPVVQVKSSRFDDIFDLIGTMGFFPNSLSRQCTKEFKIVSFQRWMREEALLKTGHIYFGMRGDESASRSKKYGDLGPKDVFSVCDMSKNYREGFRAVTVSLPIVDWSTGRVFKFLADRGDRVNPLYARGHDRVGCYPCLLGSKKEWELAAADPEGMANIKRLVELEEYLAKTSEKRAIKIHQFRDIAHLVEHGKFPPRGKRKDEGDKCAFCAI